MFLAQQQILTLLFFSQHLLVHTLHDNLAISVSPTPTMLQKLLLTFDRGNAIATGFIIIISLLNILVHKLRQLQESNFDEELYTPWSPIQFEQSCRRFSLTTIRSATNNFDETLVIGKGGFGNVYKGVIDNGTITVAVKRLSPMSKQGGPQFRTEIELLSKFRHSNIVSLTGYCDDRDEMILVYEYRVRGALSNHLYQAGRNDDNSTLSWVQRLKICIGAAHALDYLHTGTGVLKRVIHRDLKSANILLDENWAAKNSDFGLSKIGPANQSCTSIQTQVKGTFGYLDPEYVWRRRLTRKSDVYSFGVVLLEVLSGRRAVDLRVYEEQLGFVGWARQCIKNGTVDEITDPSLRCQILRNSSGVFAKIADGCLHYRSKKRPTMAQVVASLESVLALQEGTNSSMFEGEIFDMGGADLNQENVGCSDEGEVMNVGNGGHNEEQIHNTVRLRDASRGKPVRTMPFTRMVQQFFFRKSRDTSVEAVDKESTKESLQYDFTTVSVATDNFANANKIEQGDFGVVYKGRLKNGLEIVVKRLSRNSRYGDVGIQNEVKPVGMLQHRNLVGLLGFCQEQRDRFLIYEFVPNASLDCFLFDQYKRANFYWDDRYRIIRGVAQGLLYLHEDCRPRIVHLDIKPSNILLDAHMNPKISYFDLAWLFERDDTEWYTDRVAETYRYMAPEYANHGHVSVKSDVFSFGVLVLEIISGQKRHNFQNDKNVEDLLSYDAWGNWRNVGCLNLIDPVLDVGSVTLSGITRVIRIALLCVQVNAADRPIMASIVHMLNNLSFTLPSPLSPAFTCYDAPITEVYHPQFLAM